MSNTAVPPANIQSVDRALSILDLLAQNEDLGVSEIAGTLGVHKSTAFRLLSVLEAHQLIVQNGNRGKYRLGFGVVRLAGAAISRLDFVRESQDVCRALAAELNETINIAVMDAGAAVNVTQELGGGTVMVHNWLGQRTPLHATSSGKVLLAGQNRAAIDTVIAAGAAEVTPFTITDPDALRAELDRVRLRGWASTTSELEIGLNAVAAPIHGVDGTVIGAVSASGPGYRLTEEIFPAVARRLAAAARGISIRTGFVPGA